MRERLLWYLCIVLIGLSSFEVKGQVDSSYHPITILYTGKSLGVLGNTRFQKEHEILTQQAQLDSIKFKLVSHACWRAHGITIFMPSDEPEGDELERILKIRNQRMAWKPKGILQAVKSESALLFQDPKRNEIDMISMLQSSKTAAKDFPDFNIVDIEVFQTKIGKDKKVLIAIEEGAEWPISIDHWTIGEFNRVDFGKKGRLYELPVNFGSFGVRSSLIKSLSAQLSPSHYVLNVDLGLRNGDFGLSIWDRLSLDYQGLDSLGYDIVLPFEFELTNGLESLKRIKKRHPDINLLATNLRPKQDSIFEKFELRNMGGTKVGIIGLIDPEIKSKLPRRILNDFEFAPLISSTQRTVDTLYDLGADMVIAFSNMSESQNAKLSERVKGIHILAANLSNSGIPYSDPQTLEILQAESRRPGKPYLVANSFDYGIALGRIDIELKTIHQASLHSGNESTDSLSTQPTAQAVRRLKTISQELYPIQDRLESDTALIHTLQSHFHQTKKPKGDLMIPAFADLVKREASLEHFDEVTQQGRISKHLWEKFIARLFRLNSPAEISIIRPIESFLPLIGKLHEREVSSWLWFEDDIIICEMKGRDIIRLLESHGGEQLISSGIKSFNTRRGKFWMVMGRFMQDDAYYRVATTDVIYSGVLAEHFNLAVRVNKTFEYQENGQLKGSKKASPVPLKSYLLDELKRIRSLGKGSDHHKNIARIMSPDRPYEKLLSFNFHQPTLWTSLNRTYKKSGYQSVPESRINANNSFVIGASGGFTATQDAGRYALDLGLRVGFATQNAELPDGSTQKTETMDDILANLTYRYKGKGKSVYQPFARLEYDSEFSATENLTTGVKNPKQEIARGQLGLTKEPSLKWPILELGVNYESDFSNNHSQYGFQARTFGRFPLDENYRIWYMMRNDFKYYFPSSGDTDRELSLRLSSIHTLLVPLVGDLSMSVAADFLLFKGKLDINRDPGFSMLFRVGITYNRLWKPRYQSFL